MNRTSVEWLGKELEDYGDSQFCKIDWETLDLLIEQAKEMEKQQIIDAYNKSFELRDKPYSTADKYYNETYGSKGSDDHIVDTNEMADQFPDVRKMVEDKVQKLIDKDIFDQATLAMEEHYGSGCETEIDAYFRGAKWMQEQFKTHD